MPLHLSIETCPRLVDSSGDAGICHDGTSNMHVHRNNGMQDLQRGLMRGHKMKKSTDGLEYTYEKLRGLRPSEFQF